MMLTPRSRVILLVDDDDETCNLMQAFLEQESFEVLVTRDGQQAVDTFASRYKDIDLVISDFSLPQYSGRELLVRMQKIAPDVRFVLTSGFVGAELEMQLRSMGVRDVIEKPFRFERLLERINNALR